MVFAKIKNCFISYNKQFFTIIFGNSCVVSHLGSKIAYARKLLQLEEYVFMTFVWRLIFSIMLSLYIQHFSSG